MNVLKNVQSCFLAVACLVMVEGAIAGELNGPDPANEKSKRLLAFTEFARATAIDIGDIRSVLSAHKPSMSGNLAQAVFCSIHQVYEVHSPARRTVVGQTDGILHQLKAESR